jgi:predicted nucleotidyltransferase
MSHHQNITRIKAVCEALGEMTHSVLFVGGATVSLYTDRPASEVRPTDDIDILVELVHYSGYAAIEEQLRNKGFINDQESGVICRFKIQGIIVDVMPTSSTVLGFTNKWYEEGFSKPMEKQLNDKLCIKLLEPVYFLASKMEAFKGRGGGDGRMSSDFEDIVYVLNNRNVIWDEIQKSPAHLKSYLSNEFNKISQADVLYEWVSASLDYTEQKRVGFIVAGIESLINPK